MEQLFGRRFCKQRLPQMVGLSGLPLELDGYNAELNLAIEHNGSQHYSPVQFGNMTKAEARKRFRVQQEHDDRRRRYCALAGIRLIEIQQLGKITPLNDLKATIKRECLRQGVVVPPCFDSAELNLDSGLLKTEQEERWESVLRLAASLGCTVQTAHYPGAHGRVEMICPAGHPWSPSVIEFLDRGGCRECLLEPARKPVVLFKLHPVRGESPPQVADSIEAAASLIGTTSNNVRIVAKGRGISCLNYGVALITKEQAARFCASNQELEAFCAERWPDSVPFDRYLKNRQRISKPVMRSDGAVFASAVAAASLMGVTKQAVLIAVRKKQRCCGMRLIQLSYSEFELFSSDKNATLAFCADTWPVSEHRDRT